ncbi:hypothetical protein, partial [Rhizobium tibeticum]|uniref:hypothetical protein n=1 Tax=Rhizobium tibeticum TaxID=501024 RepID=UPI001AED0D62
PKATMPIAAPARNVVHEFARYQALPPNLPRLPRNWLSRSGFAKPYCFETMVNRALTRSNIQHYFRHACFAV